MKNEIILTVNVHGQNQVFNVRTRSIAKRITRLIDAMQLPGVGDIQIDEIGRSAEWELGDVLKAVFAKSQAEPDENS
jgi:hypothetical protein